MNKNDNNQVSLFAGRSGKMVLMMEVLVVLLDSARDVTALTVADNVVIKPPPVGQLPLLFMLRPDVLHHVELPLVLLVTESALEHRANVGSQVNFQIPENLSLEGTLRTLIGDFPSLTFLLFLPHSEGPAGLLYLRS